MLLKKPKKVAMIEKCFALQKFKAATRVCCKIKIPKVASKNSIILQLEIPYYCKEPIAGINQNLYPCI